MRGRGTHGAVMRLCRAAVLLALLCILSVFSFFIGAVPLSLSLFGVLLIGCLLSPLDAVLVLCAYLLLGALGLPVFSGMRGGADVLLGATGGFLLAYPFAAGVMSCLLLRIKHTFWHVFGACLSVLAFLYAVGCVWYAFVYANGNICSACLTAVLPFLPFDLCKAAVAVWLSLRLQPITRKKIGEVLRK